MNWTYFKNRKPDFGQPIFVYKPVKGVMSFFTSQDDIRSCYIEYIEQGKNGTTYALKGFNYGSSDCAYLSEKELNKLKWMEIPKP